jgi:integral membrane protein, TerC family
MPWYIYAAFILIIGLFIYIDLSVLHRKATSITVKSALFWTCVWVSLSLMFNVVVYFLYHGEIIEVNTDASSGNAAWDAAVSYFTAYLVEYSLSLDNIFVIALIISTFRIPEQYQHRLLFWGIMGAVILRGIMIGIGTAMLERFEWTMYLFGGLLIFSAIKMLFSNDEEIDPEKSVLIRMVRMIYPVTNNFDGKRFFMKIDGKVHATPMLLALLLIESCDVVFAVDSIPAVFGVTKDPFIVFTSNIFAILGLRSLYFALAGMMGQFEYLKYSLIVLLLFVGIKMMLPHEYHVSNVQSLMIIGSILSLGIIASLLKPSHPESEETSDLPSESTKE